MRKPTAGVPVPHAPTRTRATARRPGPRVRMLLPDGQGLEVTLVSWHQYRDGTWRARVRWPVWGAVGTGHGVETRSCEQEAFVPVRALEPLDGQDYRAVRRARPRIDIPHAR